MIKEKLFDVGGSILAFAGIFLVWFLGTGLLGPLHFAFGWTWRFLFRYTHNLGHAVGVTGFTWSQFLIVVTFAIHTWLLAWIIHWIMAAAKAVHKAAMDAYHLFMKVRATLKRWRAAWRQWRGEDEAERVEKIETPGDDVPLSEDALAGEEQ